MGTRFRRSVALAAALPLIFFATACSGSDTPPGDGPQTVRVMLWGNDADITSIKNASQGFIDANPDIVIKWETGDCAVDYAACKTLVAGGNMPDVFVTGSWNYFQAARDGVLLDITDKFTSGELSREDFTKPVLDALTSTTSSKIHALPMGYNAQSLFYNKDMFDAAGLAYPAADGSYTYDDVREWAALLTLDKNGKNAHDSEFDSKNIVQWGYFNFAAAPIEPGYAPVLAAFGGGVLGGPERNICTAEDPGTIAGFQWIQDLMWKDYSAITPQLQQEEQGNGRWVRGQVAMQQGSHEQVMAVQQQNPTLNYDMAALPEGPAGNATLFQIHTWAIWGDTKVPAAAWSFVKYMATEGSGTQMGLIPAYKDKAHGPDFAQAPNEPEHLVQAQLDIASWPLAFTNIDPSVVISQVLSQDGIGGAIESIITNRQTAADALKGICAERIDPILEQAR